MSLIKLASKGYDTKETWKHRGIGALTGATLLGIAAKGYKGKLIKKIINQSKEIAMHDSPFAEALAYEHLQQINPIKKYLIPGAIAGGLIAGSTIGSLTDKVIQKKDNTYAHPTMRALFSIGAESEKARNTSLKSSLYQLRPFQAIHGIISRSLNKRK